MCSSDLGNATRLNRSIDGFFIGADAPAFDNWRFGAVAGYSATHFDVKDYRSSGWSDNYHVGLYGGTTWGALAFRTGTAFTVHDITATRSVILPGLSDTLTGHYNAGTAQVFGELGYGINAGAARFEPFGLAVLEAAQAGCPLVLSDLSTFRELWDGAATFVAPGDAQGFADAIAALLADPACHAAQGEAARRRAARYTPAAMAEQMAEIYRDALSRRTQAA